ncbi:FlxA-like family protein [Gorillibacterium timonense]|uniref:FlxA-like family protein n=1 Tax=Gorillibacterium timonense TaxID=1689269 RepID=UPI00071E3A80|nr:FlxA-like family protein [Gorillibacterium timonense]
MRIQAGASFSAQSVHAGSANQDNQLKAIQSQITDTQQKLQSLSANKEMSKEAKDARKKELQEQLQSLNKQLMQRKAEILEEQRQKVAEASKSREPIQTKTEEEQAREESLASMHSAVSISTTMQQMKSTNAVKTNMEGQARVLSTEIKADQGRGVLSSKKVDKLGELNSRIDDVMMDLSGSISKINKKVKETRESDPKDGGRVEKGEEEAIPSESVKLASGEAPEALQEEALQNSDAPPSSKSKEKGQYVDLLV